MLVVIWALLYTSCAASALPRSHLRGAPEDGGNCRVQPCKTHPPALGYRNVAWATWTLLRGMRSIRGLVLVLAPVGSSGPHLRDCNCACATQERPPSPPSGADSTNTVGPVTTQRPRTTPPYIPVPEDPPSYIMPPPSTTEVPAAKEASGAVEGGLAGNGAVVAAAVASVGLLVCGGVVCIWVSTTCALLKFRQ